MDHPSDFGTRMPLNFVLVPGPLVRASSWAPTARLLRDAGHHVQIPDVLDDAQPPPAWRAWTSHLLHRITPCHAPILVGHSSASALVADLAHRLPCRCIVIVDGDVPPSQGAASPVRRALRDYMGASQPATERFRSGRDGSPATPSAHAPSGSTCWRRTRSPSRRSNADCRACRSTGSTIRSTSPAGITFRPGSFNARLFMTTRPRRRSGADGRSTGSTARISTRRWRPARPCAPSCPCWTNSIAPRADRMGQRAASRRMALTVTPHPRAATPAR